MENKDAEQISRAEKDDGRDSTRLEAAGGLEGRPNSEKRGQGVQPGGYSKGFAQAKQGQEIAVWYSIVVDGWMILPSKYRQPHNPDAIVYMTRAIWQKLANCATRDGVFF